MKDLCIKDNYLKPKYIAEDDIPRDGGLWPEYANTIMLCIDSFEDGLAQGRIHTFFFNDNAHFFSLDQMLFALEDILDKAQVSQRDSILRKSTQKKEARKRVVEETLIGSPVSKFTPYYTLDDLKARKGKLASFYLRVYARQHASMQGVLVWAERKDAVTFRSEMELLVLLRTALIEMMMTL